jgi:hypothetical protein
MFVVFLFSLIVSVNAIGWPHQFYGTVTINGNPADNAVIV